MRTFAAFLACLLCVALAAHGNLRAEPAEVAEEDASAQDATTDLNAATAELAADAESTAVESIEKDSSDSGEASSDDSEEGEDDYLTAAEKKEVVEAEQMTDDDDDNDEASAETDHADAADDLNDQADVEVEEAPEEETPAEVMDEADSLVQTAAKPEAKEAPKKESGKEAKVPEIQYDNKEFGKDWHKEWKNGDFPSYKETYSKDTFPGRKAVVAAEDIQSDGKPGVAGLSGPHVGAYLKHSKDGTIER